MEKKEEVSFEFGKREDNEFKIIERKYKDGNVLFFVQITERTKSEFVNIPCTTIYKKQFTSYDEALATVQELRKEDMALTVLEEKVHDV